MKRCVNYFSFTFFAAVLALALINDETAAQQLPPALSELESAGSSVDTDEMEKRPVALPLPSNQYGTDGIEDNQDGWRKKRADDGLMDAGHLLAKRPGARFIAPMAGFGGGGAGAFGMGLVKRPGGRYFYSLPNRSKRPGGRYFSFQGDMLKRLGGRYGWGNTRGWKRAGGRYLGTGFNSYYGMNGARAGYRTMGR